MTVPFKTWKTAAAVATLAAIWGCGSTAPEKTARSKRAQFTTSQPRGAAKAVPAVKPGKGVLLTAASAFADAASGATIQGRLERGDATLPDDGSFVDFHGYRGRRGEHVVITLESDDFDAYLILALGPPQALQFVADDDDGGGGTDARIDVTLPEDGRYTILANSYEPGETGAYVLRIAPGGDASGGAASGGLGAGLPSIGRNSTVQGRLEQSDPALDDGSYYDAWLFEGRAGERVTATMRSDDFDTYLILASGAPGSQEGLADDDDSGGGTDARIEITLPDDGVYTLIANSYETAVGAYSLTLENAEPTDYATRYPGGGDPNGRYALLVGINDYPGDGSDLASPVADVQLMRDTLVNTFGYDQANVVTLLDEDGNREHIIAAFTRHLGQAGPLGTALFYYSGHGFQLDSNVGVAAPDDPEPGDGKDEALYIWGYDERSTMLLDDELGELIDGLATDRTLVILDSCSSGSGTRGDGTLTPKSVSINPSDINSVGQFLSTPRRFLGSYKGAPAVKADADGLLDGAVRQRPHALLAGSQDDDFSYVATGWPDRGGIASVFTYYLVGALESAAPATTFRDLMNQVREQTTSYTRGKGYEPVQTPQLAGELSGASVTAFFRGSEDLSRGLEAYRSGNHTEAAKLLVPLAEDAGVDAWLALAQMYEKGAGVTRNSAAAFYYAQRALTVRPDSAAAGELAKRLEGGLPEATKERAAFWASRQKSRLDEQRFLCLSWSGQDTVPHDVVKFRAGASIQQMAADIVYYSGLAPNFVVEAANVGNAAAGIDQSRRIVAFDPAFLQEVNRLGTPWAAYSIMAHEIGHHLQGHTIVPGGSRPPTELEADEFSGFILARMGATLNEAQVAMRALGSESGSDSHPGRNERLVSIEAGWNRGRSLGAVREGGQPLPPVRTGPPPPTPNPGPMPGPGPMPPPMQVARQCVTQMGACPMMMPVPVGSPCYCMTPTMGPIPGIAR